MSKVASHTWLLAWNESMTRVQNRSKRSRALWPGSGSPMAGAISAPKSSIAASTAALSSALVEP